MPRFLISFFLGFFLIPSVGLSEKKPADLLGLKAPSFDLKTLEGKALRSKSLLAQNKITIVNFWATWCSSCVTEFPEMENLLLKLKSKGVAVIAINVEESPNEIRQALRKIKISFPVLLDSKGEVKAAYNLMALPSTFLIDQQGIVRQQIVGGTTAQSLEIKIQKILKLPRN